MKGIVLEVSDDFAVILTDDGQFKRVRVRDKWDVGNEVIINEVNTFSFRKYVAIAAMFLLLVIPIGVFAFMNNTVYTYISVDINPSFELGLNRFDKVVKIVPLNNDAENLFSDLNLRGKKVEDAFYILTQRAIEKGYIKKNDFNEILVTVLKSNKINDSEREKLKEKLVANSQKALKEHLIEAYVDVFGVDKKLKEEAQNLGLSPGKYLLYLESQKKGINITIDEVKNKSIRDLIKEKNITREELLNMMRLINERNGIINKKTEKPVKNEINNIKNENEIKNLRKEDKASETLKNLNEESKQKIKEIIENRKEATKEVIKKIREGWENKKGKN